MQRAIEGFRLRLIRRWRHRYKWFRQAAEVLRSAKGHIAELHKQGKDEALDEEAKREELRLVAAAAAVGAEDTLGAVAAAADGAPAAPLAAVLAAGFAAGAAFGGFTAAAAFIVAVCC